MYSHDLLSLSEMQPEVIMSKADIETFCKEHGVAFYSMGCPDNWDDQSVFRVMTHDFPSRGITVPLSLVRKWFDNPPYVGENI